MKVAPPFFRRSARQLLGAAALGAWVLTTTAPMARALPDPNLVDSGVTANSLPSVTDGTADAPAPAVGNTAAAAAAVTRVQPDTNPFVGSYIGVVQYNVKKYVSNKRISNKTTTGFGKCFVRANGSFSLTGFHITKAQHGTVQSSGRMGNTQTLVGNGKISTAGVLSYTGQYNPGGKNRTVQTWYFVKLTR